MTLEQFVDRHCRGKWLAGRNGGWWLPLKPTPYRVVAWKDAGGMFCSKLVDGAGTEIYSKHRRHCLDDINPHAAKLAYRLTWPNFHQISEPNATALGTNAKA